MRNLSSLEEEILANEAGKGDGIKGLNWFNKMTDYIAIASESTLSPFLRLILTLFLVEYDSPLFLQQSVCHLISQ